MGEVDLGMPGPWAEDFCEAADHYTTKIGGLPDWPFSKVDIKPNLLKCSACGSNLCLVTQIYTPISSDTLKIEERIIYVFGCITPKCGSSPLSWSALRVQKSYKKEESSFDLQEVASSAASSASLSNNKWLETDLWGEDDADINNEDVDLEELGRALSEAACLASHSKKPNGYQQLGFDKKGLVLRPITGPIDASIPVVPCFYIYSQEESLSGDVNAVCSSYLSLSIKENQSDLHGPTGEEIWEEEGYEYDRALYVDRTYLKFKKRMDAYPEQCFRYSYGGKPLLATRELEKPGNCGFCGAPRHYEMQLMPPLLFYLQEANDGSSAHSLEDWNWMTLIVYTCSKSCSFPLHQEESSINGWTVAEEAVIIQFEKPLDGAAQLGHL